MAISQDAAAEAQPANDGIGLWSSSPYLESGFGRWQEPGQLVGKTDRLARYAIAESMPNE